MSDRTTVSAPVSAPTSANDAAARQLLNDVPTYANATAARRPRARLRAMRGGKVERAAKPADDGKGKPDGKPGDKPADESDDDDEGDADASINGGPVGSGECRQTANLMTSVKAATAKDAAGMLCDALAAHDEPDDVLHHLLRMLDGNPGLRTASKAAVAEALSPARSRERADGAARCGRRPRERRRGSMIDGAPAREGVPG